VWFYALHELFSKLVYGALYVVLHIA
jgi:hypothetical protein